MHVCEGERERDNMGCEVVVGGKGGGKILESTCELRRQFCFSKNNYAGSLLLLRTFAYEDLG